ncbi:ATP binding [Entomophthora muscae]|uniref:ATP binding n=1 Tax=Entomophthora muscae TaxID=34485 RepID=A0ACC2T9X8_9FUNG|nr:ATP binding [Entomophthora muscae]
MKGLTGFKKSGASSRELPDTEKQPPGISLNLSNISNFNLVSPPFSLSTTAANSADSFQHPAMEWSELQVIQWLREKGLEVFEQIFYENDINGQVLLELNHPLLKMMNISPLGYRIKILEAIKELKREYNDRIKSHEIMKNDLQLSQEASQCSHKISPLGPLGAFLKRSKNNSEPSQSESRSLPGRKTLLSDYGLSPPISPELVNKNNFSIMSYDIVKQKCIRVSGSDHQSRVVNLTDARDAHTILSRVLEKFNISEDASKYAIFVASGDSTRSLQEDELVEICNSSDRPEREKFILRKKHHPVNHIEFKKYHAQRLAAARLSPRQEPQTPVGNTKHDKLTKIFGTRPPSELISSSLPSPSESTKAETRDASNHTTPQTSPQLGLQPPRPRNRTPIRNESSPYSSLPDSPSNQTTPPLDFETEVTLVGSANGNRSNRPPARSRPHQC